MILNVVNHCWPYLLWVNQYWSDCYNTDQYAVEEYQAALVPDGFDIE